MSRGSLDKALAALARRDLGDLDFAEKVSIPGGPVFTRHTDDLGIPGDAVYIRSDASPEALMLALHDKRALRYFRSLPPDQQVAIEAKIAETNQGWAEAWSNTVVLDDAPPGLDGLDSDLVRADPPPLLPRVDESAPRRGGNDIYGSDSLARRLEYEAEQVDNPRNAAQAARDVRDSALSAYPENIGKKYPTDEIAGLGVAEEAVNQPFVEPTAKKIPMHKFEDGGQQVKTLDRPDRRAPMERTDRLGGYHTDRTLGREVTQFVDDVFKQKFVAPRDLVVYGADGSSSVIPAGTRLSKSQIRATLDSEPGLFDDLGISLYEDARGKWTEEGLDRGKLGDVKGAYKSAELQAARGSVSPEARRFDQTVRAAGTNPGAPIGTDISHEDAIAAGISPGTLPDPLGSKFTQPAAERARYAILEARKAYGGDELIERIRSAPEEEAVRLAYEVAEGTLSRHLPTAESVSAVAKRDAVHGFAAALLEGVGRRPATLPDAVLDKDNAAVAADLASGHLTESQLARPRGADDANASRSLTEYAQPPRETRILPKPFARGVEADAAIGRQPYPNKTDYLIASDDGPADVTVPKRDYRGNVGGKTADELVADFQAGRPMDEDTAKSVKDLIRTRNAFADHLDRASKGVSSGYAAETPVAKTKKKFDPRPETNTPGPTADQIGGDNSHLLGDDLVDEPSPDTLTATTPDTPAATTGKPVVVKPKPGTPKAKPTHAPSAQTSDASLKAEYESLLAMAEASDGSDMDELVQLQAELDGKFAGNPNASPEVLAAAKRAEAALLAKYNANKKPKKATKTAAPAETPAAETPAPAPAPTAATKETQVGLPDEPVVTAKPKPKRGGRKPAAKPAETVEEVVDSTPDPTDGFDNDMPPEARQTKPPRKRKPAEVAAEVAAETVAADPAVSATPAAKPAARARKRPLINEQGPKPANPAPPPQASAPAGLGMDGDDIVDDAVAASASPAPGTGTPAPGAGTPAAAARARARAAAAQQRRAGQSPGPTPAAASPPGGSPPGGTPPAAAAAGAPNPPNGPAANLPGPTPPPGIAARIRGLATRNKMLTAALAVGGTLGGMGAYNRLTKEAPPPSDDKGWGLAPPPSGPPPQESDEAVGVSGNRALKSVRRAQRQILMGYNWQGTEDY